MSSAQFRIIAAFLVGAAGVLSVATLTRDHDWGGDFAGYIMQAASIVRWHHRRPDRCHPADHGPVHPSIRTRYLRMGVPVTAGTGLRPTRQSDRLALESLGVCSLLLFLVLLCLADSGTIHTPGWLLILVGLFALNPLFIAFPNFILSDLPFLAVSTFTVLFIGRVLVDPQPPVSPGRASLLLESLRRDRFHGAPQRNPSTPSHSGRSTRTRSPAPPTHLAFNGRLRCGRTTSKCVRCPPITTDASPRSALGTVRASLCRVPIARLDHPNPATLMGEAIPFIRMTSPSNRCYRPCCSTFSCRTASSLARHFHCSCGLRPFLLRFVGSCFRYRTDYHIVVYSVFTYLLYTLRPFLDPVPSFQGLRYLFPILPFYISFAITGLASLAVDKSGVQRRLIRALSVATPLLLIAILGGQSLRGAWMNTGHRRQSIAGPFSEAASEMFAFLRQTTDSQAIIVFFKPRVMRSDDQLARAH